MMSTRGMAFTREISNSLRVVCFHAGMLYQSLLPYATVPIKPRTGDKNVWTAVVLVFVGLKMMLADVYKIPVAVSLLAVTHDSACGGEMEEVDHGVRQRADRHRGDLPPAAPATAVDASGRDAERPAQTGDGLASSLFVDQPVQAHRRSVSRTKKVTARFKISRSCSSSRT